MPATAANLRDLHELHQRAKALRDRLTSEPKTLASRKTLLETKRSALEAAKKHLQEERVQAKKRETMIQSQQGKIDELKGRLNQVRKNDEYKAIQNQIAHDQSSIAKLEDELLQVYEQIDGQAKAVAALDAEFKTFEKDVEEFSRKIQQNSADHASKLQELESAVVAAEHVIPEDQRERYRRSIKQWSADALAAVENSTCAGCFVSVTPQMLNELINANSLVFCKTCGRILYLAEDW